MCFLFTLTGLIPFFYLINNYFSSFHEKEKLFYICFSRKLYELLLKIKLIVFLIITEKKTQIPFPSSSPITLDPPPPAPAQFLPWNFQIQ